VVSEADSWPTFISKEMTEPSPLSTVRSFLGDGSLDVDTIFQSLLLQESFSYDDSSESSGSALTSARSAVRSLRQTGTLGEMSGEAFARLLAGTLYEYDYSAPPTPIAMPGISLSARTSDRDLNETLGFLEAVVDSSENIDRGTTARASEVSFVAVSEGSPSPSSTVGSAIGRDEILPSPWSTARSEAQSDGFWRTARTVLGETSVSALGQALGNEQADGAVTANVRGLLRQLAGESDLDETFVESARRILQLGAVANGERLSEEEIQKLPKARFEEVEQQTCSICLEGYLQGEILTALRCKHFFHTSCVTRWFQRSTQCPLCRTYQGAE